MTEVKHNSHGGPRQGAGRKRKEKTYATMTLAEKRKIFNSMVSEEEFKDIVKNYIAMAKKSPQQAEFLINQLIGKPMQAMEVTGRDGKDLLPLNRAKEILQLFVSPRNYE